MNKDFDNINDLIEEVKQDKVAQGANSSMLNRYPVRFVLFDNFSDSKSFVSELIELGVTKMQKIIDWMDKNNPDQISCRQFVAALTSPKLVIEVDNANLTSPKLPMILANNESQTITGTIWGGNLSVVSALTGSEYLPRIDGGIVFLEDVGEQTYRLERMLYELYLAGVFKRQQAIVFGSFSGTGEDSYDKRFDVATVVRQLHQLTGLPIYSGLRFGHIAQKSSFPLGATCEIKPNTTGGYQLSFADYPTIEAVAVSAQGLWK